MSAGKAVIGQSGGPTAVINKSLVGFIKEAINSDFDEVLGAKHGLAGMLSQDFVDLSNLSESQLYGIGKTPAAALGSVRKKPTDHDIEKLVSIFEKQNIRNFFYIGGNDSAETANLVAEGAKSIGYEMKAFHIPKTIDNDLLETDHCPGYGSAARFVAHAFQGDDADNRSLNGIKINVLMGRHAGWLTAASTLGKSSEEDGPHLVYVPEKTFNIENFLKEVKEVYDALGRCVVAVSEGVHNEKGEYFLQTYADQSGSGLAGKTDSHGNIQLSGSGALGDTLTNIVSEYIDGARVRADTFGYLQRSFIADVSSVDAEEAERVGQHAVVASRESQSGSVILKRQFSEKYYCEVGTTELRKVAKHTKEMPSEFIDSTKPYVTNEFFEYAMPLTGGIEPKTQIFV
ncbi:MAG: diphosphate--fructose-6-phosphate 1-phosphotransferase [Candidatus Actinomarina sp.]|nr:diphosphate--fructose-6-phosphate 1-phosphotransferase [Actinomycetota bacterium]MBL6833013.1 diphosphate--fructose-6-phosphate 1-phosphotransferase [Candidatus Actinomarina sp.]MBL6836883.1 diphosphate--fructose-6-phosphate 1-phosphotransferase [Candidatus Actinomarina sp.]MDB4823506.1 diphosphate--fructose-6-phosphate 1-phosphotransferase [Acidimicrobiia bacterium]